MALMTDLGLGAEREMLGVERRRVWGCLARGHAGSAQSSHAGIKKGKSVKKIKMLDLTFGGSGFS